MASMFIRKVAETANGTLRRELIDKEKVRECLLKARHQHVHACGFCVHQSLISG